MGPIQIAFTEAQSLLSDGVSVIPVRDKDEEFNGKMRNKKSPYGKWEKWQTVRMTPEQLFFNMDKFGTAAIATLGGVISGNLEIIDIDVKWYPGIDKLLFDEIKTTYPHILPLLRINKTPSGGWHILYRVVDGIIPGNKKLAARLSTEEELRYDPKAITKCFLETRGEGGYVVAPPSLGYSKAQDRPIPVLSWDDRCGIIALCESFNQIAKEEKIYSPTASESQYYDENPFAHFNKSVEAESILLDHGWKFHTRTNRALSFTRPGSKSGDEHAFFLFEKRLYKFFTSNSEFDTDRCYNPSTVLAKLAHGGDKKITFSYLTNKGFGKLKKEAEKRIVRVKAMAGEALPPNVSDEAKEAYAEAVIKQATVHPYGLFWQFGEKDKIEIVRERLYMVAEGLGFRWYRDHLRQIVDKFVYNRNHRYFQDTLKSYIHEEDGDLYIDICSAYEAFMQKSGEFSATRLRVLQDTEILTDTRELCYKFYLNGFLKISVDAKVLQDYQLLGKFILAERIQPRAYRDSNSAGRYFDFLSLACRFDTKSDNIRNIIGYLAHEYKDETTAYIVVLTEECPDPKQGGGSGKNVFCNLLENTTTLSKKNGAQVKFDEKFLQSWMGERIMSISDVRKDFDYSFLKEPAGGAGILKKLYKDEVVIPVQDMPKFIIQTNYGVNVVDGGMDRRIVQIEFTNFFTLAKGVDTHFGCHFPTGWDAADWAGYDNLIVESVQAWMRGGLKLEKTILTGGGFTKQFDQMYGVTTREFIEDNWPKWKDGIKIMNDDFSKLYADYCTHEGINDKYRVSAIKMNKALEDWCKQHNCVFEKDSQSRDGLGNKIRVKEILPNAPF